MIQLSDCDKCKNCIGIDPETKLVVCKAFQNGIPLEYYFGKIDIHSISECANGYKFDNLDNKS